MSSEIDFKVNITTLYDMLEEHDFSYWDSKDPNVYQEGADWWEMIQRNADTFAKKRLVKDYENYIQSGPSYGTPQLPKPEKPE